MLRTINTEDLIPIIANLCKDACYHLNDNVMNALENAYEKEESPYGKETLLLLLDNAKLASKEEMPVCHDTGMAVVMMEIGEQISWTGKPLEEAVNDGVRKGYTEGYLRKSVYLDPLNRVNSNDNTPCVLHTDIVPGDKVKITVMPKGGGSENMGTFKNLVPADGYEGVKKFILESVFNAGGKACPPIVVGVGIGGTMDKTTLIAKQALLRPIGVHNKNPFYENLEKELLDEINKSGIGPLGMGGRMTALDVHIEYYPCHITSLPVAVNLQCHSVRQASAEL
ncbi:fumarate hydratase [Proteiniclasticum ruminis]|uniref:Fumarate hydratase subunit alpha n=1 Tax=Proteiniclasticum ruminis TaxID=398199 RepID=A0A1G8HRI2_9CLOT|nr:fumarate hydratase [Proteiniclasticum ruminis]SDI09255.1 fumarate hydratase subunit alpha [Proteiniclasticum ruminis]